MRKAVLISVGGLVLVAIAGGLWLANANRTPASTCCGVTPAPTPAPPEADAASQPADAASQPTTSETVIAEPIGLVPAESMLAWYGRPLPDAPPPEAGPTQLDMLLATVPNVAGDKLGRKEWLSLRILQGCAQMIRYNHAIALIDTSAKHGGSHPDSRQLDKFKLAFVVKTKGNSNPFGLILSDALEEQTSNAFATLTNEQAQRWPYRVLHDKRLPEWCDIAFGEIGDFFVLTIGQDVWPMIASVAAGETQSLAADPWVVEHRDEHGRKALIEIFVGADRMRERLDPLLYGRVSKFFAAWDADNLRRAHWALGLNDKTLYCVANFVLGDSSVRRVYARDSITDEHLKELIPAGARHAVYDINGGEFLRHFIQGIYAWQPEETRELHAARWELIQKKFGFDAQKDILDNLGDTVVLHNFPHHPLNLPAFFTTVIEVPRNAKHVRQKLDELCTAWREALIEETARNPVENPGQLIYDDGVWYVQIGPFTGMAWAFVDGYIVFSWSPAAVRQYIDVAGDALKH